VRKPQRGTIGQAGTPDVPYWAPYVLREHAPAKTARGPAPTPLGSLVPDDGRACPRGTHIPREPTRVDSNPARSPRARCVCRCTVRTPSDDERKRSSRDGRNWHKCARCGRWFLVHGEFSSQLGRRITVCGVLLDPPEPSCMMVIDGEWWWPKDEALPDLVEIDRKNREACGR
jgi:hypothetical protein